MMQIIDGNNWASLLDDDDSNIIIEANSPGLEPARSTIPTSADSSDSVIAVAKQGAGKAMHFFNSNIGDFPEQQFEATVL